MKDAFFGLIHRAYSCIYSAVLYVTYFVIMHRMSPKTMKLTYKEKKEICLFWKQYGIHLCSFDDYKWYKSKGKNVDPRLIPEKIYHSKIEPYFTNLRLVDGFQDKNYFDSIIDRENSPKCVCRCINNVLLDAYYAPITEKGVVDLIRNLGSEVICKPSMDSCGGKGIRFFDPLSIEVSIVQELRHVYNGNFIIQELVSQHELMNQFNDTSLNTIRLCTFLYKGTIHILDAFLRFGKKGSKLDNLSSGGLCVPINADGKFIASVLDDICNSHPLNAVKFDYSNECIPMWDEVVATVRKYHYKLPHFQLINWDVALDKNGTPVIVEYNLIDTDAYCHQITIGPIFGEMTDDVLKEVFSKRENKV